MQEYAFDGLDDLMDDYLPPPAAASQLVAHNAPRTQPANTAPMPATPMPSLNVPQPIMDQPLAAPSKFQAPMDFTEWLIGLGHQLSTQHSAESFDQELLALTRFYVGSQKTLHTTKAAVGAMLDMGPIQSGASSRIAGLLTFGGGLYGPSAAAKALGLVRVEIIGIPGHHSVRRDAHASCKTRSSASPFRCEHLRVIRVVRPQWSPAVRQCQPSRAISQNHLHEQTLCR